MTAASENLESLRANEIITEITRVLRTNERVCRTVGPSFAKQMGRLYLDLLNCYKAFSGFISARYGRLSACSIVVMDVIADSRGCVNFVLQYPNKW